MTSNQMFNHDTVLPSSHTKRFRSLFLIKYKYMLQTVSVAIGASIQLFSIELIGKGNTKKHLKALTRPKSFLALTRPKSKSSVGMSLIKSLSNHLPKLCSSCLVFRSI